jgi:hypothetical protein
MLFVDHKTRLVYPSFQESKTASEACRSKCDYEKFAQQYQVTVKSYHAYNGAFRYKTFQKAIDNKHQHLNCSGVKAQWQNDLVERSSGTVCTAARSMLNHAISRWDKTMTAELWPFAIQHAATIYNTTKRRSRDYDISPCEQFTGEHSKCDQNDMHPLLCPVYVLDRRIQEGTPPPKWRKLATQKVYVGHLRHYSKSVPMVWDPKTKPVLPQFHFMFDDNFDTVQAPDPNITQEDTMDRLFKTNRYKYDDPFGNEHTYLFSHGGVDIHPDNLTPTIETCQASFTMTSTHDEHHSNTQNNTSTKNTHNNTSILSMQYLVILHANNMFPQSSKDGFKAYKRLHGIDMQIHYIPKTQKQKAEEMELSDLHDEEFKIFALEYNTSNTEPNKELDHYMNTLQRHNEDFNPCINDMFLNNLDPTFYAMQMQNPDVLTHAQMKQQVDSSKFIEAQRPEIEDLMDIHTFEFTPKINLPPKTRYLDLIWTYRRKCRPYGSLEKYKARLCVNDSRQIEGIDYTESFAPVVQWSTKRMVSTLAAMHNLKGKHIDFTQAFPQAKLKEDMYLRFPAGFEHKNEKRALKLKCNF